MLTDEQREKLGAYVKQRGGTPESDYLQKYVTDATGQTMSWEEAATRNQQDMASSNARRAARRAGLTIPQQQHAQNAVNVGDILTTQILSNMQQGAYNQPKQNTVSQQAVSRFSSSPLTGATTVTDSFRPMASFNNQTQPAGPVSTTPKVLGSTSSVTRAMAARQNIDYLQNEINNADNYFQDIAGKAGLPGAAQAAMQAQMESAARKDTLSKALQAAYGEYRTAAKNGMDEADSYLKEYEVLDKQEEKLTAEYVRAREEALDMGVADTEHLRQVLEQQQQVSNRKQQLRQMADEAKSFYYASAQMEDGFYEIGRYRPEIKDESYKIVNGDPQAVAAAYGKLKAKDTLQDDELPLTQLTDDEKRIYNYLYMQEGKEAAQKFIDYITPYLRNRLAEKQYGEMNGVQKALYWLPAGMDQWARGIENFGAMIKGDENVSPSTTALQSGMVREEAYDKSKVAGTLYDIGQITANQIPNLLLGYATGGATEAANMSQLGAKLLTKTVQGANTFASSGGNYYQEALSEGLDLSQARSYAILSGAAEAGLESVLGGFEKITGVGTDKIAKLAGGIKNGLLRAVAKAGAEGLGEGIEEGLQDILSPLFKNILTHSKDYEIDWAGVGQSFIMGALSTVPMNATTSGAEAIIKRAVVGEHTYFDGFNELMGNGVPDYYKGLAGVDEIQRRMDKLSKNTQMTATEKFQAQKQGTYLMAAYEAIDKMQAQIKNEQTQPEAVQQPASGENINKNVDNINVGVDERTVTNGQTGNNVLNGSGQRNVGIGAGEQTGAVAAGTGTVQGRPRNAVNQGATVNGRQAVLNDYVRAGGQLTSTTGKAAGIRAATDATLEIWTPELIAKDKELSQIVETNKSRGIETVITNGGVEVNAGIDDATGEKITKRANGIYTIDKNGKVKIFIDAMSSAYTATQLNEHETFHALAGTDPTLKSKALRKVAQSMSGDELRKVLEGYVRQYSGVYDGKVDNAFTAAMADGEAIMQDAAARNILEEVAADAYADINRHGDLGTLKETVRTEVESQQAANQTAQTPQETRGPPEESVTRMSLEDEPGTHLPEDEVEEFNDELPNGTEADTNGTEIIDGDVVTKYSLNTWTDEEQKRVHDNLVKEGFDEKQVDKWIKDVNGIAAIVAANKDRLDFEAAPQHVYMKPNDEYVVTLDSSTLCDKRRVYQGTFDAIAHALGNTVLTSDDVIKLVNMMKEKRYKAPCSVCYVESRRRHLSKFANEWLQNYTGEYKPTLDEIITSDGLEKLRQNHEQTYNDFVKAMNRKGSSNPKVVQLRTEYRGDLKRLTKKKIEKIKKIGGLRLQSFSDFEIVHLLDNMQVIMDAAALGLPIQAYTKVPEFAWAFGGTGAKINLSLIAEGSGLDSEGNLIFSSTEGMDFDTAMEIREAYSDNVGTILVGVNNAHILAAWADPRIDFVIPFHRSGWGSNELALMGMDAYDDYTDYQKERYISDGKGANEEDKISLEDYWDYNKTGKENAQAYLNLCAERGLVPKFDNFLVNNGDGTYSLQPDGSTDGYWKSLGDFKLYNNEGIGSPQTAVQPNFNIEKSTEMLANYEGGANTLPVADDVVERFVNEIRQRNEQPETQTRFSLDEPVEYTKDFVALHNLTEDNLLDSIKLGGLPSPSIAIVDAKQGHSKYGPISLVFRSETIDPEFMRQNKVYGSDAWTPTASNARVEYQVNQKAANNLENLIYDLSGQIANGMFQSSSTLRSLGVEDDTTDNAKELARRLSHQDAVKAAYLAGNNKNVELVYQPKKYGQWGNKFSQMLIDGFGYQQLAAMVARIETNEGLTEQELEQFREMWAENKYDTYPQRIKERNGEEVVRKKARNLANDLWESQIEHAVKDAWEMYSDGGKVSDEIDRYATQRNLSQAAPDEEVAEWILPEVEEILGEPGIYNGKDKHTNSGASRSFKQLHWEYTAENIVKAMQQAESRGANYWGVGGEGLTAVASTDFKSIDQMHQEENRLMQESDEAHRARLEELDEMISDIIPDIRNSNKMHSSYEWEENDIIGTVMMQAAQVARTPAAIQKAFAKEGYTINAETTQKLLDMYNQAAQIPTGYFEAKPQRVVGFDEVVAAVVPDNMSVKTYNELTNAGVDVKLYPTGDEQARLDTINGLENIRFSIEDEPMRRETALEWKNISHAIPDATPEQLIAVAEDMRANGVYTLDDYLNRLTLNDLMASNEPEAEMGEEYSPEERRAMEKMAERKRNESIGDISPELQKAMDAMGAKDVNDYMRILDNKSKEEHAERVRTKLREEFKGTELMNKYDVQIAGTLTDYSDVQMLRGRDKAYYDAKRAADKAIKRLRPTEQEEQYARLISNGIMDYQDFNSMPAGVDRVKVNELIDYYDALRALSVDIIANRKRQINDQLIDETMPEIFKNTDTYKPLTSWQLEHSTPTRIARRMFGEDANKVISEVFDPIAANDAGKMRFVNGIVEKMSKFEDGNGKKTKLNSAENELVAMMLDNALDNKPFELEADGRRQVSAEAEAAGRLMANLDDKGRIKGDRKTWEQIEKKLQKELERKNLKSLPAEEMRKAEYIATELRYKALENGIDKVHVKNAVEAYKTLYNELYDIQNDFYVAHGFHGIGFQKNYNPRMQPETVKRALSDVAQMLGIKESTGGIPASIAGLTSEFKPSKRWNAHDQSRTDNMTTYFAAQESLDNYLSYLSDILYHTDDIMRIRAMEKYFRAQYAPDMIREEMSHVRELARGSIAEQRAYLEDKGIIKHTDVLSDADITLAMDKYIEDRYANMNDTTTMGKFTAWAKNYGDILAGKQSMADRSWEYSYGRETLNTGNRLLNTFARSAVAASLTSTLNQTSQLPMILNDIGPRYTAQALAEIATGKLRKIDFTSQSDYLTGKQGVNYLTPDKAGEKVISAMYVPAEFVDNIMSQLTVRGEYLKQISRGRSEAEAMRLADAKGRQIMASRLKGSAPTAFAQKNAMSRIINMFAVEALNGYEYAIRDFPSVAQETGNYVTEKMAPKIGQEAAEAAGKRAAAVRVAQLIVGNLIGAFVLNRLGDKLYGGTPAQLDLAGMALSAFASGYSMDTNAMLEQIITNGLDSIDGDFDFKKAGQQLGGDIVNDVPMARNFSALLGIGDNTLPLPNFGEAGDLWKAVQSDLEDDNKLGTETIDAIINLAAEFVPGGRQLKRTWRGVQSDINDGVYYGFGDDRRLAATGARTFAEEVQAALFGTNALQSVKDFYASGDKALGSKQTRLYDELVAHGADGEEIYNAIHEYRDISNDKSLDSVTRGQQERALIAGLNISDRDKNHMYNTLANSDSREEKFDALLSAGLTFDKTVEVYDRYSEISAEDLKAQQKATKFAMWLDQSSGLSEGQKDTVNETLKYWQMIPADAQTYEKYTAAGMTSDEAGTITEAITGLETTVEKIAAIIDTNLSDAAKRDAIGTLIDKDHEMYTEAGNLSSYGKFVTCMDDGLTIDQYLQLREGEKVDAYIKGIERGLNSSAAYNAASAMAQLDDDAGAAQQIRAAVSSASDPYKQIEAIKAVSSFDTYYPKAYVLYDTYGIRPEVYATYREYIEEISGGATPTYDQAYEAIERMSYIGLSNEQKAALFSTQNLTSAWYTNNPYSTSIGKEAKNAVSTFKKNQG